MNTHPRIALISPDDPPDSFPDPDTCDSSLDGLLAIGGDLSPSRLLAAYRRGIFPWYEPGQPILWWSPDPRAVLTIDSLHVSRRLARTLRQGAFDFTADGDCQRIIRECRRQRLNDGTWITMEMERAYCELHRLGHVHSIEVWHSGELVGGVYGVLIGTMFFGESMYSARRDASKIALVALRSHLAERGGYLIDCQVPSPHLETLGMRLVARSEFQAAVEIQAATRCRVADWRQSTRNCSELVR